MVSAPVTTTTTTTTTTEIDSNVASETISVPVTGNCRGIPLLELAEDEYITEIVNDNSKGGILFATSKGRILSTNKSVVNAYLTGERKVYAEVTDGFGNISNTSSSAFLYALYNKIVEINENKEIEKWVYEETPSAIMTDRLTGVFLSPIMCVNNDLGFWKELMWREDKPDNTEITICIRIADSSSELKTKTWDYCFTSRTSDSGYGSTGVISRSLDDIMMDGKCIQFKVTMTTDSKSVTPSIADIAISYSTKFAVYFYTIKFAMENNTNVQSGLVTATITEPQNTEITFGVTNDNSANWNNYQAININEFFALDNFERVKAGIKMVSYDSSIPEVAEFALLMGGDKDNTINS